MEQRRMLIPVLGLASALAMCVATPSLAATTTHVRHHARVMSHPASPQPTKQQAGGAYGSARDQSSQQCWHATADPAMTPNGSLYMHYPVACGGTGAYSYR